MTLVEVCEELERELDLGDCVGWMREEKRYIRLLLEHGSVLLLVIDLRQRFEGRWPEADIAARLRFASLEKRAAAEQLTGPVVR